MCSIHRDRAKQLLQESRDMLTSALEMIEESKQLQKIIIAESNPLAKQQDEMVSSVINDAVEEKDEAPTLPNSFILLPPPPPHAKSEDSMHEDDVEMKEARPRRASIAFEQSKREYSNSTVQLEMQESESSKTEDETENESNPDSEFEEDCEDQSVSDEDIGERIFDLAGTGVELLTAPPEMMMRFRTVKNVTGTTEFKPNPKKRSKKKIKYLAKKGYLLKEPSNQGGLLKPKRRVLRWFEAYNDKLVYMKTDQSTVVRGMFTLENAKSRAVSNRHSPTGFELLIYLSGRRKLLRLCPKSKREALEWQFVLDNNIKRAEADYLQKVVKQNLSNKIKTRAPMQRQRSKIGVEITKDTQTKGESYYDILRVSTEAPGKLIKRNYYTLARSLHPDKNPDADPAEFSRIQRAFDTLYDPIKREKYDLCESVKLALRHGIVLYEVKQGGSKEQISMFIGETYEKLYIQSPEHGCVLSNDYEEIEMRSVQKLIAGENFDLRAVDDAHLFVVIAGEKLNQPEYLFELDTRESRNDFLDGIRQLRLQKSMLFRQTLEQMELEGFR